MRRALLVLAFLPVTFCALSVSAQGRKHYPSYTDVQPVLAQFQDALPAQLRPFPGLSLDAPWSNWIQARDGQIRARLAQGDQDTILNWLMYGTTFTTEPRALLTTAPDAAALERLRTIIGARTDDLIRALQAPGTDERRLFSRRFFEGNGFSVTTVRGRAELREHLLQGLLRVADEQEQFAAASAAARAAGDPVQEIALSQRMFAARGLSLDTSLAPNFAIERALAGLKAQRLAGQFPIVRVGVIGAGLDFADKDAGFDNYPIQTVQPFAIMDALRQLELTPPTTALDVVALDISPRVIDHMRRARTRAAAGASYTLTLPLPSDRPWLPEFREYWRTVGLKIGSAVPVPARAPTGARVGQADFRTVRLPAATVRALSVADLNVVTERLDGPPFDLIVATNVLVYYDPAEQAIALSNIAAMLRDGGLLLSNTVLPEVPALPMTVADLRTTTYSADGVKDVIVTYRKTPTP